MKKNTRYLLFFLFMSFGACVNQKPTDGPYFGNGFHNGWADQNSIVIWTRLTATPEMKRPGLKFITPSGDEARALDESSDAIQLNRVQLPEKATLEQMEGACPGKKGDVKLVYYPLLNPNQKKETEWETVDPDKNFTQQWKLQNLEAGTKYVVKLFARHHENKQLSDSIKGSFGTPPSSEIQKDLKFCIVTCHDYPRRDDSISGHKIYPQMLKLFPDFYVHTGDVEYYDKPGPYAFTEELMRFKWDRIFALPFQRTFYTQVTTYFMKDDHDALTNDAYPGMTYGSVTFERGLDIFDKEQFPSNDKPYKTIRWGKDLQIWITEGRNYRSPNDMKDGPGKTILGQEQKEWLMQTLKQSDATFKILISPDPIVGPDRKNKKDNYANAVFKFEGDELRTFLNQFTNVFICNGDRHWQYVTHPEGTNLWEFGCGPGSDSHAEGWPPNDKRPEHRFLRLNGGFLLGTVSYPDSLPLLTFSHMDVNGKVVHEEKFQIKNNK